MTKERESITIDSDVNEGIHKEAARKRLSFSSFVNTILHDYLMALKKPKSEGKKKIK